MASYLVNGWAWKLLIIFCIVDSTFNDLLQDQKCKQLHSHFPARAISINFEYVDTIFIENSHKAMSTTTCGTVVIWSDALNASLEHSIDSETATGSSSFRKEFIKSIKLSEHALRVIRSVDGYVMLCDAFGHIRFYDKELKILFWCPSHDSLDSIITISFDLIATPIESSKFPVRDFFVRKKKFPKISRNEIFSFS